MAEPILKWAGGKRQILHEIKSCFPPANKCEAYHEPFFGGGAVFFKTAPHENGGTVNDINERLMNFYEVVKTRPEELIEELRSLRGPREPTNAEQAHSDEKNYYYQQREIFNHRPRGEDFDEVLEAALLLYLNQTCYNGLFRENSKGEFNVPIGDHSNLNWDQGARIMEAHRVLQRVEINCGDFSYVEDEVDENDLVYFDPPYEPVSKTSSFVEYHTENFDKEEQQRLCDLAVRLDEMDVYVVISNSPPMRELYEYLDEFLVHNIGANRVINSDAEGRGKVSEIIVTNVSLDNRRGQATYLSDFADATD